MDPCLETPSQVGSCPCADSRSLLNASFRSLLRTYILSPRDQRPSEALVALLTSPRVRMVDLSYLDDATGTTLIHEAARRRDLRMVELAVRAGADVFMRDRRGRTPCDGYPKDDKVRVFLRQCEFALLFSGLVIVTSSSFAVANLDVSLLDQSPSSLLEPPEIKGYLNKYANVAKGYSTRWFVLRDGVLSCTSTISCITSVPVC